MPPVLPRGVSWKFDSAGGLSWKFTAKAVRKPKTERCIAKAALVVLAALAEIPATTTTAAPITKLKHVKSNVNPITTKPSEKLNTKSVNGILTDEAEAEARAIDAAIEKDQKEGLQRAADQLEHTQEFVEREAAEKKKKKLKKKSKKTSSKEGGSSSSEN
jgi:hypothetical protein